jgi:O-antigen/teichoic acid export membrane protein/GT2 family glycosyltransferase
MSVLSRVRPEAQSAIAAETSVVVITRRPSLAIARLLRSLGRAGGIGGAQVLIGLNGPMPAAAAFLRRLAARALPRTTDVRVVELPRSWPGDARNALVASATGSVLLFLDDDVEVRPDVLERVRGLFVDPEIVAAGGPNLTPPRSPVREQLVGLVLASPIATGPLRHRYRLEPPHGASERALTLCNLAVRREDFDALGFREGLVCAEENELLGRLHARGTFFQDPQLAVYHHRRETLARHVRQMAKYGFGRGQLIVHAPSAAQLLYLLPAAAAVALVALAAFLPLLALAIVAAYLAVVVGDAVRVGGLRQSPTALGLLVGTHAGYALGTVVGAAFELLGRASLRPTQRPDGRLARDAVATLGSLVVAVGAGVGASVLVARVLGPSGRGAFELARTLSFAVGFPAGLGLGRAAVFLRRRGEIERDGLFATVGASFVTGTVVGASLLAVLLASGWSGLTRAESILACGAVPFVAFYLQGQSALRGVAEAAWFRRTLAARDVLFLLGATAALALHAGVTAVLVAWLVHWLLGALCIAVLLRRVCGRPRRATVPLRRIAALGAPQALIVLFLQAHLRVDVLVVGFVLGTASVGTYAAAFGVAELLTYAGTAIGFALFPRTAEAAAGNSAGGAERTAGALRVMFLFVAAGAVLLAVAGPALVSAVFGSRFAGAGTPLQALLPGAVALALVTVLANDMMGRGRTWPAFWVLGGTALANLGANLAVVPHFGLTGAAVVSSFTYVTAAAGLIAVFCRTTGTPVADCLVPRRSDFLAATRGLAQPVSEAGSSR